MFVFLLFSTANAYSANVYVSATAGTTGPTGYSTLEDAFYHINNRTHQGKIIVTISSSTVETMTSILYASGVQSSWDSNHGANFTPNYTSVLVYPTNSGVTITNNSNATLSSLIRLVGADKVRIDGRLNGSGSSSALTLSNSKGGTVLWGGGAANNCIQYTVLKGSGSSYSVVTFNQDNSEHNDKDSILYCSLTAASQTDRPFCGIYTPLWTSSTYHGLTIVGNRFYDLWNAGKSSYSIMFNQTNITSTGILIAANSFYETTNVSPTGNYDYNFIYSGTNGSRNVYTVTGNYLGGRAAQCGGSAMTLGNSSKSTTFIPLNMNVSPGAASYIDGNTIANMSLITASSTPFIAINSFYGNLTITNNTIGSTTGTGSIILTGTAGDCISYGIYADQTSNTLISNNAIGSITAAQSNNKGHSFYGIFKTEWFSGSLNIIENMVGSVDTPNSIQCTSPCTNYSDTSQGSQQLVGIYAGSSNGGAVSKNTVGYLTNFSTRNNSNNSIYGIYCSGDGTYDIDKNFILHLNAAFSGTAGVLAGIYLFHGIYNCTNNIVYLGEGITSGLFTIYGIADFNNINVSSTYDYNTVNISGTAVQTARNSIGSSTAFYKAAWGERTSLKNNIFVNMRIGNGPGLHSALNVENYQMIPSGVIVSNYNDLYVNPNSAYSYTSVVGGVGYKSLSDLRALSLDLNSLSMDPAFLSVGNNPVGFIPTADLIGDYLEGSDFGGTERPTTPTMGAWETSTLPEDIPVSVGIHWTGNEDTAWNKTANWIPKKVPTLTWPAIIPQRTNQPSIGNNVAANAKRLSIQAGAIVTVNSGGTLTVSDEIYNENGTSGLVLNSTAAGTGSLIYDYDNVQATVKRYIPQNETAWYFLSTPVASQTIRNTTWTPSGTHGDGTGYDLYVWDEPSSCWVYNLNDSASASATYITWPEAHPESTFVPGRGYLYGLLGASATKEFAGALNNGVISRNVTKSATAAQSVRGFNFLGNPYPSSIDWKANAGFTRNVLKSSGTGYDVWIWSQSATNYGVYNSGDADGVGTNNATRYIVPMQGFMVLAVNNGAFSFNNNARVHNEAGSWLRSATSSGSGLVSLTLASLSGSGSDQVDIRFGYPESQEGALKLFSSVQTAPSLYVPLNSENYSVLRLTEVNDYPRIPVSFKVGESGRYTITCQFDPSTTDTLYLQDKLTGTIIDFQEQPSYTFSASTADVSNRFVLYFGAVPSKDNLVDAAVYLRSGVLTVDLSTLNDLYEVTLYDLNGNALGHKSLSGGQTTTFQVGNRGVYFVKLRSGTATCTKKVVF